MSLIKILIIEDDPILLINLREKLTELNYENILQASSALSLEGVLKTNPIIDIIFLDIHLGEGKPSGFDLVKKYKLNELAIIIPFSGFTQEYYREQAKELGIQYFLEKNASKTQIDLAIDFAMYQQRQPISIPSKYGSCPFVKGGDHIFIKSGTRYESVKFDNILFMRAEGSYTEIITTEKKFTISINLKNVLSQMPAHFFLQVHRSYVISLDKIHSLDSENVYFITTTEVCQIPLSKQYRDVFFETIHKIRV